MVTRPSSSSSLTSFHILLYCLILILSCPLSSHRHQSTGTRCSLIDWERTCSRLISSTLYTPVIKHMRDCLPVMPLSRYLSLLLLRTIQTARSLGATPPTGHNQHYPPQTTGLPQTNVLISFLVSPTLSATLSLAPYLC